MDRRTYGLYSIVVSVVALTGLSGCNDTGFSTSTAFQKELDNAANPQPSPTGSPSVCYPASCAAPAAGCRYINQVIVNGCLRSCGTLQCDPIPSSTPSPSPSPSPSVTPSPSPSASPSPSPTATPTPTPTSSPTPPAISKTDVFNISASGDAKVDMLFCVDNSGSMSQEQQVLADSMNTFIGQFVTRGIDFHLGMVTTDVTTNNWSSKLPGYVQPARGRLLSKYSEKYLTSSSLNVVEKFKANTKPGTSGDGSEQCFNSILYALENSMISSGGFNEGFMRDDSLLAVVIFSDENENLANGETVQQRIERMRSRLSALKGPNSRGFSIDFVVDKNASAPAGGVTYPLGNTTNSYPDFYLKAAVSFGSQTYNIKQNVGASIAQIGANAANAAEKEFRLSAVPLAGSLSVKVDGVVIVADPANGYVYKASTNSVELFGTAIPRPGARVTIEYMYR